MEPMTGRSRVPPKGDARPLGSKKLKKVVATQTAIEVTLDRHHATLEKEKVPMNSVTLIRKPSSPKGQTVVFGIEGLRGSVRFSKTLFAAVPEQIAATIEGIAAPKPKETKEERKARLAAQPKKTDAERLAALEQKTARMRERLAKKNAPVAVPA